jgi:tetratricopeptide (TPR) repeat protein
MHDDDLPFIDDDSGKYPSRTTLRIEATSLIIVLTKFYEAATETIRHNVVEIFEALQPFVGFDGKEKEIFEFVNLVSSHVIAEQQGFLFHNLLDQITTARQNKLEKQDPNELHRWIMALLYSAMLQADYALAKEVIERADKLAVGATSEMRDVVMVWRLNLEIATHGMPLEGAAILEGIFARTGNTSMRYKVSCMLARYYNQQHDHSAALQHGEAVYNYGENTQDPVFQMIGAFEVGVAVYAMGNKALGKQWLQQSRYSAIEANDELRLRSVVFEEIRIAMMEGDYETGHALIHEIKPALNNFPHSRAYVRYYLGAYYLNVGEYDNACIEFSEILPYFEHDAKDIYWQSAIKLAIGTTHIKRGDCKLALKYLDEAFHLAQQLNDSGMRQQLFDEIAKATKNAEDCL